jgi:hypothetical protein
LRDVLKRKNFFGNRENHRQIESCSNSSAEPLNCISPITVTQEQKPLVDLKPFDKYNAEYHKAANNQEYHKKYNVLPAGIRIEQTKSEPSKHKKPFYDC